MTDLPPIGAKVLYAPHGDRGAVGTVEARRNEFGITTIFIRWPQGGGMWANVTELEAVKPARPVGKGPEDGDELPIVFRVVQPDG